jgi:hypothetical protein
MKMKALEKIQQELKAPKGQYNSFGKYKYRSCEDIVEAVKPLLAKNGCQLTLSDDMVEIGGRVYVKATATITDGKETEVVTAYAREPDQKKGMDESQITGTASSYARKYALNGLLLIDDTKDPDTDEYHQQTTQKPAPQNPAPQTQKASEKQIALIIELAEKVGMPVVSICKKVGVSAVEDIPAISAGKIIDQLKGKLAHG